MRQKLGVLLVEGDDGTVSVQLVENPDAALPHFKNLSYSKVGKRATFVTLTYHEPNTVSVEADMKSLDRKPIIGPSGFRDE